MKNKKAIYIVVAIIILVILIVAAIYYMQNKTNEETTNTPMASNIEDKNLYNKNFGSYKILENWVQSREHSTGSKFFYVKRGQEQEQSPNNVSINAGTNKYAQSEHEKFKTAILNQLSMQIGNAEDVTLNASGSYTDNGYILYTFIIQDPGIETTQYYIVGDYKYVLVQETVFNQDEKEETDNLAREIVNTFKWKE